jgi:hydroxymethylpyrimidine pyrophosphatase-like HAD family hydrolase
MIELVVTDLDGTFWGRDLTVPPAHAKAVEALAESGIPVLIATSRRQRVVEGALRPQHWAPPAVLLDGVVGVDLATGVRFHQAAFDAADAHSVLAVFRSHGLDPCLYIDSPDADVVLSDQPSTCARHAKYLSSVARQADLADSARDDIVQGFSIFGAERALLEKLLPGLSAVGAEVVIAEDDRFGGFSIVVSPPAVTKWTGVVAYCKAHDISVDAVAAVGDGDNDLELLRHAALRIAVRGGSSRALDLADLVIDPPAADGWAAVPELLR